MCLTIPGKIISIKSGIAEVRNGSRTAFVDLGLVLDARPGDWVLYATNRAVKRISEADATEIISLLEDHYHPVDVAALPFKFKKILFKVRSRENNKVENRESKVESNEILKQDPKGSLQGAQRAPFGIQDNKRASRDNSSHDLTKEEIVYLLSLKGKNNLETLYAEANSLRKEMLEDFVCIHGIIEFSNYCRNNCLYCGIRKSNNKLPRYRMDAKEIAKTAVKAIQADGYKLIVLQSGEDPNISDKTLLETIKEIKKKEKAVIFLSVGERSREFYKNAFELGARGSLMRFETSNPSLYEKMRPGHKLEDRLESLNYQKRLGYYIASGSLVGLPEQTLEDVADDLLTIQKIGIPMISAGPYIEAKNTPLQISNQVPKHNSQTKQAVIPDLIRDPGRNDNKEKIELILKYIAIARLMMPEIKIPVTTALETLDPENGRHKGLLAGANALMFNLTPEKYCADYNIYDNKYREREKVWQKYGLFKGEESWEMLKKSLGGII